MFDLLLLMVVVSSASVLSLLLGWKLGFKSAVKKKFVPFQTRQILDEAENQGSNSHARFEMDRLTSREILDRSEGFADFMNFRRSVRCCVRSRETRQF